MEVRYLILPRKFRGTDALLFVLASSTLLPGTPAPSAEQPAWQRHTIDAADRGFNVIVVSDACETLDAGSAEAVQILFGRIWGYVMTTADVLEWLRTGEPPAQTRRPAPPD